jgi:hypothetical protein
MQARRTARREFPRNLEPLAAISGNLHVCLDNERCTSL